MVDFPDTTNFPSVNREIATPEEIKAGTGKGVLTPEKKTLAKGEFEVPNMLVWQSLGDILPATAVYYSLYKAGTRLYLINGTTIMSCPLSNPASWVVEGTAFPVNAQNYQVYVVGEYIYVVGGLNNMTGIYRAHVNDPTNFSVQVNVLPNLGRREARVAIIGGYIYLMGGDDAGGATGSIDLAPITDPTNFTRISPGLDQARRNSGLVVLDDEVYYFGGDTGGTSQDDTYFACVSEMLAGPLTTSRFARRQQTAAEYQLIENKRDFAWGHCGNHVWILGGTETSGNDTVIYRMDVITKKWEKMYGPPFVLPNGESRNKLFFGQDGHAYMFGGGANGTRIYRTTYKRTATRLLPEIDSYASERGVYDDGSPVMLTAHQKYGTMPWTDTNSGLYGNE